MHTKVHNRDGPQLLTSFCRLLALSRFATPLPVSASRLTGHVGALMSAFGPKRTSLVAPHMSAFGGKADMTVCGNPLLRSLFGVKRTCPFALHMSAVDPKRICAD